MRLALRRAPRAEQRIEQQQPGADRDGRIGDVEGREIVLLPVHLDEIDDVAEPQPVDDVAERAAQDQRQRGREQRRAALEPRAARR